MIRPSKPANRDLYIRAACGHIVRVSRGPESRLGRSHRRIIPLCPECSERKEGETCVK